jgi:SAM-dependent methyltransferase
MDSTSTRRTAYPLGHEDPEITRLERQAGILAPATRTILTRAGLEPGMRVLDLGTGVGDVAMLAADLVGPSGSVVGVDLADDALRRAAIRVGNRDLRNITLVRADATRASLGTFDAVVGRLVLLYTPDPAAVLRHHARQLAPGGLLVAMEYDMQVPGSTPAVPIAAQTLSWIRAAFEGCALDSSLGARLPAIFADAGLGSPEVLAIQPYLPPGEGGWYAAATVRTLMPHIERLGIASAEEIGLDTLAERIDAQCREADAWLKPPTLTGAWCRVPQLA